jgi:hypothetical protein
LSKSNSKADTKIHTETNPEADTQAGAKANSSNHAQSDTQAYAKANSSNHAQADTQAHAEASSSNQPLPASSQSHLLQSARKKVVEEHVFSSCHVVP